MCDMKRIIFSLPEELFLALQRVATEEKRSVAAVLRDAAEQKVATRRPKPKSIGSGYSEVRDIARRTADEEFVPEPFR